MKDGFVLREIRRSTRNLFWLNVLLLGGVIVFGVSTFDRRYLSGSLHGASPLRGTMGFGWLAACTFLTLFAIRNLFNAVSRFIVPQNHPSYLALGNDGHAAARAAEIDAETLKPLQVIGKLQLTPNWILKRRWLGLAAIRLSDLMWTHKRSILRWQAVGGIAVRAPRDIYRAIFGDRRGKWIEVKMKESVADNIIGQITARAPWAIFGYAKDVESLWRNDRENLIAMVDERRAALMQGSKERRAKQKESAENRSGRS